MNVDKLTSVTAALDAGKLPSQKQITSCLEWIQQFARDAQRAGSSLQDQTQSADVGKLSEQGAILAADVEEILEAYKVLGKEKNWDDIVQETLYDLSRGDVHTGLESTIQTPEGVASKQEVKSDAQSVSRALRGLFNVFVGKFGGQASPLLAEFLSFLRLSTADVAEVVEDIAAKTKDTLRETETEVQDGQRDALGRTKPEVKAERGELPPTDTHERFEQNMDTAKVFGSKAIGAGQRTKATAKDMADTTASRVTTAFDRILERAQNDPEYRDAIGTLFDLGHKWASKSLDTVDSVSGAAQSSTLDGIVQDPTGRTQEALRQFTVFIERLANTSTENIQISFRAVLDDIRNEPELRRLVSDASAFARRSLDDQEFVRSDAFDQEKDGLRRWWQRLVNADTEQGRKLRVDTDKLAAELQTFQDGLSSDPHMTRLKDAHAKFGKDLAKFSAEGTMIGQAQIPWIWKDILNVYLPQLLEYVKQVPIPRTEYKDSEVEFVVEDLDIQSIRLLPGHAHLSATVDIDVDKPAASVEATTDTSTKTRLDLEGLSMILKEVSFWYHDASLKLVGEVKGLMDITIPPKGVDVSVTLSMLPTASGQRKREKRGGFHTVDNVKVTLASGVTMSLKQTNHQILISTFKPIVRKRIISTIQTILEQRIRMLLEMVDGIAWDTYQRAGVFDDAGLHAAGPKYAAAIMSEMGKLSKEPGLTSGWTTTSIGVVKNDPRTDSEFAMGAGPQIISGDKHGPKATFSTTPQAPLNTTHAKESAKGTAKDVVNTGLAKAKAYKDIVQEKKEHEKAREGWRSSAYDFA